MNTIILASLLFAAASAHAYQYLRNPASAPVYSYGSHGHFLSAHDSHGSGTYDSHGHQRGSGNAAHDSHAIASHGVDKAYEADGDDFNKYKNVGAYSHDKGEGFEKVYKYEKVSGHHDITANDDAYKATYGDHDAKSHHESQAHGTSGHKAYESHSKFGANNFGSQRHTTSAYSKSGHGYSSPASSGHLLGGHSVGQGLEGHMDMHQGYSRYPVGHQAEYIPRHGNTHGYSKVYFKGPGYGYHY